MMMMKEELVKETRLIVWEVRALVVNPFTAKGFPIDE